MTKKQIDLSELGTDAVKWSEAFTNKFRDTPYGDDDLRAWFANMIETGRTAGEQSVRDSFAEVTSGADLSDVINAMKSGHPIRISAEAVDELVENAKAEQRRAGLNDTGDVPVIDLPEANAVEFVNTDDKVWLNVDGRCRARVGKASIVITEWNGNRAVIFDDRVAVLSVIDET